eukprot:TRINITY_DN1335_c0_g2_i11.p1 TRINITY_DN1335_c0_g2~~TRINITY_DN1335_c0_g2_i11.p1  ORF type:complete len:454 (+),score=69.54 TRINITY_DN1335_c0_g2_i11:206-1567(+)
MWGARKWIGKYSTKTVSKSSSTSASGPHPCLSIVLNERRHFRSRFVYTEKKWLDVIFYKELTHKISTNRNKKVRERNGPGSSKARKRRNDTLESASRAIKTSLGKGGNPFRKLIDEFQKIFLSYYRKKLKKFNLKFHEDNSYRISSDSGYPIDSSGVGKIRKQAMADIGHFSKLLVRSISVFYRQIMGEEKLVRLKECISTYVLCYIIRKEVYHFLVLLYRLENVAEENILCAKIDKAKSITPQEVGIKPYLCLNKSSPREEPPQSSPNQGERHKLQLATNINNDILPAEDKDEPYESARRWLRRVVWTESAWKKLKLISHLNEVICECVDQFWKGTKVDAKKLRIDADQYMSIMVYIILKANTKNLYSHVRMAVDLTLYDLKQSYNNYCLTTFQACFSHLIGVGQSVVTTSTRDALHKMGSLNGKRSPLVLRDEPNRSLSEALNYSRVNADN